MSQRIRIDVNLLWPYFRTLALRVFDDLYEDGFDFRITSGYRGEDEQNALYTKGRTAPGPKVTNAKYGESPHNFGIAIDLTAFVSDKPSWDSRHYEHIGKYARHHGLKWGGDFKSIKDMPHIELDLKAIGLTLADLRKVYASGKLPAVWALLDKALKG